MTGPTLLERVALAIIAPIVVVVGANWLLHKFSLIGPSEAGSKIVVVTDTSVRNSSGQPDNASIISGAGATMVKDLTAADKARSADGVISDSEATTAPSLPTTCIPHIVRLQDEAIQGDDRLLIPRTQDCLTIPQYSRLNVVVETCNGRIPSTGMRLWAVGKFSSVTVFSFNNFPEEADLPGYIIKRDENGIFNKLPRQALSRYLELSFEPLSSAPVESRHLCYVGLSDLAP